jgi:hypothetical protein
MKAKIWVLAAAFLAILPLFSRAQQAARTDPDIEAFDARVAAMSSVAKPIEITLDVIGFNIRKGSAEEKQLGEVASAGSGKYFPVANAADLARVFTQVTTGVAMGGGGVVPSSRGGPGALLIGSIILLLAALILAVGIVVVQRRRTAEAAEVPTASPRTARRGAGMRVSARLDVVYADGGSKSVPILSGRTTIGRSDDCGVVLRDSQSSSAHAEIVATSEGFVLRDLGSTNGTFLNGQSVSESPLYLGDRIVIGTTSLTFGE